MSVHIVVGLQFGDEGKGIMTDYLVSQYPNSLVVRFNGGHQAGHTVCMEDGRRHVFSNFGSGSFRNVPTYWSNFCTIDPIGIVREFNALCKINVAPRLYIDALCPVTTFYDMQHNRMLELERDKNCERHGSCGVGFGATVERNLGPYKLYAQDLKYPEVVKIKLEAIFNFYNSKGTVLDRHTFDRHTKSFLDNLPLFHRIVRIVNEQDILSAYKRNSQHFIFEGAQGIMLDQDFGFFPHVTRSHTTSRNALQLIERNDLDFHSKYGYPEKPYINIYYLTRAYQTRHGAGPMTNEGKYELVLKNTELETNKNDPWQEQFRKSVLDLDLLKYALDCDSNFSKRCDKNLVMSCIDQVNGEISFTKEGELMQNEPLAVAILILKEAKSFYLGNSPLSKDITKWKNEKRVYSNNDR